MIMHFAHDLATAYGDASHADAATCADLARFAAGLPIKTLTNSVTLARALANADFGDDLTPYHQDHVECLRDVLGTIARDAARFYRMQLALPLPCPFEDHTMAPVVSVSSAPILPPVGDDDHLYSRPMAAPGLISYRIRGRYGFIAIGALSAVDAMLSAALSTGAPSRDALEVWCDTANAYVPAVPDYSEGAPVSRDVFWRIYAAIAAGFYQSGRYCRPAATVEMTDRDAGVWLARTARSTFELNETRFMTAAPVACATLKAVGMNSRLRTSALAFIRGLVA